MEPFAGEQRLTPGELGGLQAVWLEKEKAALLTSLWMYPGALAIAFTMVSVLMAIGPV